MEIRTVLGAIAPEDLGITRMHEHLFYDLSASQKLSRQENVNMAITELRPFVAHGGKALVEVTNMGMGRDVSALEEVSRVTGLKIIASTGFYKEHTHPGFVSTSSVEELAALMVRELTSGIEGSGIQAGIIAEIGTGETISALEEKVFSAAARAQHQTGAAISTHTTFGKCAAGHLDILQREGADLRKVVLGHMHWNSLDTIRQLVDRGAVVEFDCIGRFVPNPGFLNHPPFPKEEEILGILVELIREGYVGQIALSSDIAAPWYFHEPGGKGYGYLLEHFVPLMEKAGIKKQEIKQILVDTPARLLAF